MDVHARLTGQHGATLDPEGRLLLAKAHRDVLNPDAEELGLVATLMPEGAVALRVEADWERWVARFEKLPESADKRWMLDYVHGNSSAVRLDKQGRVRIPDWLLEKADVARAPEARRRTVVVGAGDHVQVWSPERRLAHEEDQRRRYEAKLDGLFAGDVA